MTGTLRTVYRYGIALLALWVLVLVFLAGFGIFETIDTVAGGAADEDAVHDSFGPHAVMGILFGLATLLLVLVSLGARLGRNRVLLTAGLFGLFILQMVLAGVGREVSIIGALHPVNALVILSLVVYLAHGSWRRWTDLGEPAGSPRTERV